jgi:hypothetical protein
MTSNRLRIILFVTSIWWFHLAKSGRCTVPWLNQSITAWGRF